MRGVKGFRLESVLLSAIPVQLFGLDFLLKKMFKV